MIIDHPRPALAPPIAIAKSVDVVARTRNALRGRRFEALNQLGLIVALLVLYRVGRLFAHGKEQVAFANARVVWSIERALQLPSEVAVQDLIERSSAAAQFANGYYAVVHFPVSALIMLWLWVFRPRHYRWTRNMMVALTGAALVLHIMIPLAPPRMLADLGFVDLANKYGQSVYGAPETDSLSNQFAAMPSLHVGWAVLFSIGVVRATRMPRRWLVMVHPVVTTVVVVATANHFWLDGIVAVALIGVAACLASPLRRWRTQGVPSDSPSGSTPGRTMNDVAAQHILTNALALLWG